MVLFFIRESFSIFSKTFIVCTFGELEHLSLYAMNKQAFLLLIFCYLPLSLVSAGTIPQGQNIIQEAPLISFVKAGDLEAVQDFVRRDPSLSI